MDPLAPRGRQPGLRPFRRQSATGFTYRPPPGWPNEVPPAGWRPGPGWPPAPPGWQFWHPRSGGSAALGVGLDLATFTLIWLTTVGAHRLEAPLTQIRLTTWFWLWIAGFGTGLIGIVLSRHPATRRTGLAILATLPVPALIGGYLMS